MKTTCNLEELIRLYGRLPSFHDSRILRLEYKANALHVSLYIYEPPMPGLHKQDWDRDLHVVCTLRFHETQRVSLCLEYNSITKAEFIENDGAVAMRIFGEKTDEGGEILAHSVIVESVEYPETRFQWRGRDTGVIELVLH